MVWYHFWVTSVVDVRRTYSVIMSSIPMSTNSKHTTSPVLRFIYVIFHFGVLHVCSVDEISRHNYSLIIILTDIISSSQVDVRIRLISMDKMSEC